MLRKTPWNKQNPSKTARKSTSFRLRLGAQATIIALSALFISACSTPQGSSTGHHKIQSSHSNDIWQRIRDNFAMPELENQEVYARVNYYTTRADYVSRMATRSGDFLYLIMDEVERRHMPSELALLPFVESAFVTSAKSSAAASGLWQFMPATGRDFALQQNRFADQRNDVMASTSAALDYLQRLYNTFGDWHLALAAYNWGQGNVNKAINRSYANGGSGKYTDINMPLETRQYVPKLQAIKNIVRNPSVYGLSLPNIPNQLRHEAILVTRDIDVSKAAELANLSEDEFKRLNPAYKRPIIVGALNSKILVPADRADDFRSAFNDKSRQLASLTTYTTFSSEALSDIASKYNTDENRLRELNNIPYSHNYVRADSTLIVPRTRKNDEISYLALNSSVRSMTGDIGITDYNTYTPSILASSGTNTSVLPTTISSGSITAPGRATTGLVADASDADQLSALISNAPSKPAYAPIVNPVVTTPAINDVATTRPSYITENPTPDTLIKPLVTHQMSPIQSTAAESPPDSIAQLTANTTSTIDPTNKIVNNDVSSVVSVANNVTTDISNVSETKTVSANEITAAKSAASVTPNSTNLTPIIDKTTLTTAVAEPTVTAPKTTNKNVVKTTYRVPKTKVNNTPVKKPAPTNKLNDEAKPAAKFSSATSVKSAASIVKPALKAPEIKAAVTTNKAAAKTNANKITTTAKTTPQPNKPEPKKPDSKAALNTTRNPQQNTQKAVTTGKMANKEQAAKPSANIAKPPVTTKPTAKPVAKATPKVVEKTTEKPTNKTVVKPPAKPAEDASKKVTTLKKKINHQKTIRAKASD